MELPCDGTFLGKGGRRLKTFQTIQDDYSLDSTLVHGLRPDRLQNVITKSIFAFL